MLLIPGLFLSYFIGAIPTAFLLGKLFKRVDIRKHGSGNVGATNAFRVLGPYIGTAVLLIDTLKGIIPVVLISDFALKDGSLLMDSVLLRVMLGITAVLGHSFTVFLRFKGGKGMAAALGMLIGLSMKIPALKLILILEIAIWLIVFIITKIVSAASLSSAIFFPIFFIIFHQPPLLILMSLLISSLAIFRHKPNIIRLLQRKEPRLNFTKTK